MTLTHQIQIKSSHSLWEYCNDICFGAKNLYNYANYLVRQEFINNKKWIRYNDLDLLCKSADCYKALPAQTSQQILRLLDKNWISFFKAIKDWTKNKDKYLGRPKLPHYKPKDGRSIAVFTNQQCKIKDGYIKFPKGDFKVRTNITDGLQQVRIVPNGSIFVVEVIYKIEKPEVKAIHERIAGIDLGLNNLATLTNNIGFTPIVINGRIIKSVNHYYNKRLAELKSQAETDNKRKTTKRIQRLILKRNNKVKDCLHKTSRFIVDYLVENRIDTLVIGNNTNWKQEVNIGKRNNQNFVQIPYAMLIQMLQYKCAMVGIDCIVAEESYTSKASFLDSDVIPKRVVGEKRSFSGKRIKRGMYRSSNGTLINADCNGSYNITRKVFPNAYADGIEGVGLHPIKFNIA